MPEIAGIDARRRRRSTSPSLRGHPVVDQLLGPVLRPLPRRRCRSSQPKLAGARRPTGSSSSASSPTTRPTRPATFIADVRARRGRPSSTRTASIKQAYRVVGRPQSYFIDRDGILRSIQIGEVTDADFERQYADDLRRRMTAPVADRMPGRRSRSPASTSATAAGRSSRDLSFRVARRRDLRPARAERRRQDDDGRDHRGLPARRPAARSASSAPTRRGPARDHRARVGLMLQGGGGIDPRMTAREVLRLHGRFHAAPRDRRRAARARRAGRGGRPGRATGGCRAGSGSGCRARARARRAGRSSSILDEPTAGHGRRGAGGDAGAAAGLREEGVDGPPDEPRPGRRRADRPTGSRSSTAAGSSRWASPEELAGGAAAGAPVPARDSRSPSRIASTSRAGCADVDGAARRVERRRGRRPLPRRGRGAVAGDSSPRWPPGAARAARSSWSCGAGAASLEERYLELVGGGDDARRDGEPAAPRAEAAS